MEAIKRTFVCYDCGKRHEGESNLVLRKTDEYPPYRRVKVCNHCHSGKCPVKKSK